MKKNYSKRSIQSLNEQFIRLLTIFALHLHPKTVSYPLFLTICFLPCPWQLPERKLTLSAKVVSAKADRGIKKSIVSC